MHRSATIRAVLFPILLGPLLWAGHFLLVYGGHTMLCADAGGRVDPVLVRGILGGITLVVLLALGLTFWRPELLRVPGSSDTGFRRRTARWLVLLSAFGVLWVGLAVLMLPACQQLR